MPTITRVKTSWKKLKEVLDRSRLVADWQWRYPKIEVCETSRLLCPEPWLPLLHRARLSWVRRLLEIYTIQLAQNLWDVYVSPVADMFLSDKRCETAGAQGQPAWPKAKGSKDQTFQQVIRTICMNGWMAFAPFHTNRMYLIDWYGCPKKSIGPFWQSAEKCFLLWS